MEAALDALEYVGGQDVAVGGGGGGSPAGVEQGLVGGQVDEFVLHPSPGREVLPALAVPVGRG